MYIFYFLVWIIFNGQITLEIVIFGLVVAAVVYAFSCKFLNWSPTKDLFLLKRSFLLLRYAGILIREIVKANMAMIRMTVAPNLEPDPVIVKIHTKLQSKTARVILANSITLTPGTITVSLEKDELMVHCLDRSFSEGLEGSVFEQALLKLEEGR
ncbi:MAG: Na+/H+ antiporter subunit E [Eubacteriales bacterium]|nr:Na+/H+ antiporter subunit E [Eubacteriales bacterium]